MHWDHCMICSHALVSVCPCEALTEVTRSLVSHSGVCEDTLHSLDLTLYKEIDSEVSPLCSLWVPSCKPPKSGGEGRADVVL